MSIYATMWEIHVSEEGYCFGVDGPGSQGCECVDVYAQAVPDHIDNEGGIWEWLPPMSESAPEINTRCVFICGRETRKGTPRNGQEYVNPLVVLTGKEYMTIGFRDLWGRILDGIEAANKPAALRQQISELEAELASLRKDES